MYRSDVMYALWDVVVQVVDLLVAMCRAALESPRKSIIFEPYPSVVDPNDPKTLAFNPKVIIYLFLRHINWVFFVFYRDTETRPLICLPSLYFISCEFVLCV